jgi:hypothetical protein
MAGYHFYDRRSALLNKRAEAIALQTFSDS